MSFSVCRVFEFLEFLYNQISQSTMQAQKQVKKTSKKQEPLFTQEERNTIPFVRTVSNKIRNINKKLSDIKQLEAKPADQLKPEQKEKISKKDSLFEEISKFEDVLRLYRSIENERKQGETSEADRTIHYIYVTRELQEHGDDLVTKGVITADELKTIKSEPGKPPKTIKDEINHIKSQVKEFFSSEPKVNLIEKIAAHKQFLNLKLKKDHKEAQRKASHNEKATSSQKPQKAQEEHPKNPEPVGETSKVEKVQAVPAPAAVENVGSQQQEPPKQTAEVKAATAQASQQTKSPEQQQERKQLNTLFKNKSSHRSRGAEQWPTEGSFSREEKAKLAEDGFTVVEKVEKKVSSKHSTKQFGPRRDNRQYHQ